MNYRAAALRAELRFSARAYCTLALIALVFAVTGWHSSHPVAGFHVLVSGWCIAQAHADAVHNTQLHGRH